MYGSSAQFAEEFLLIHAIFESLPAIDEDDRNFIGIEAPDLGVRIDINFTQSEAATLVQF